MCLPMDGNISQAWEVLHLDQGVEVVESYLISSIKYLVTLFPRQPDFSLVNADRDIIHILHTLNIKLQHSKALGPTKIHTEVCASFN